MYWYPDGKRLVELKRNGRPRGLATLYQYAEPTFGGDMQLVQSDFFRVFGIISQKPDLAGVVCGQRVVDLIKLVSSRSLSLSLSLSLYSLLCRFPLHIRLLHISLPFAFFLSIQ